jgi:hypothetical protein
VSAAVGLVFLVDPALRPDPRTRQAATLASVALDVGVSERDAAARVGLLANYNHEKYCVPGTVAYLEETLEGFKHRRTLVRYIIYDASTGQRLPAPDQNKNPLLKIASEVPSDQSVSPVWVQWPNSYGKYFVRFELFHNNDLLAVADTRSFSATQAQDQRIRLTCIDDVKNHRPAVAFAEASAAGPGGGGGFSDWLLWTALFCGGLAIGAGGVAWIRGISSARSDVYTLKDDLEKQLRRIEDLEEKGGN